MTTSTESRVLFPPQLPEKELSTSDILGEKTLDFISEYWNVVRSLPLEKRQETLVQNRFESLFYLGNFKSYNFINTILTSSLLSNYFFDIPQQKDPNESPFDKFAKATLKEIKKDIDENYLELNFYISMVSQIVKEACLSNNTLDETLESIKHLANSSVIDPEVIKDIASSSIRIFDPDGHSLVLSDKDDSEFIDIHIQKMSNNPFQQKEAIINSPLGVSIPEEKRGNSQKAFVRGVSWLVQERNERMFQRFGISREEDAHFFYFDIKDLMNASEDWPIRPKGKPGFDVATIEELFTSAMYGLNQSPKNIRTYLETGALPDVGVVIIPREKLFL